MHYRFFKRYALYKSTFYLPTYLLLFDWAMFYSYCRLDHWSKLQRSILQVWRHTSSVNALDECIQFIYNWHLQQRYEIPRKTEAAVC